MRPFLTAFLLLVIPAAFCAEPDYSAWDALLAKYYDPTRGMDYAGLKASDAVALGNLRQRMARVDVAGLSREEQLAYWINLYNINVVGIVVDHYPVKSVRDISTDPIRRLNVFEKASVPFGSRTISLDEIEHKRIREGFRDPRIHFAINCAARSCPPMPARSMRGATLNQVLDDQTRQFLRTVRIERKGDVSVVHTTRIMDWFKEDFERWGGGSVNFLRRYLPAAKQKQLKGKVRLEYTDYDWSLNSRRKN